MYRISDDVLSAIKNKLSVEVLTDQTCKTVLDTITRLYVDTKKTGIWLWDKLSDHEESSDSNGWSLIPEFVSNNSCIMFFNQDEETKMFMVSNGKDLQFILSETCGYEFYITDLQCSYLLCFNHHDDLIGCGNAKKWVKELKEKHFE